MTSANPLILKEVSGQLYVCRKSNSGEMTELPFVDVFEVPTDLEELSSFIKAMRETAEGYEK